MLDKRHTDFSVQNVGADSRTWGESCSRSWLPFHQLLGAGRWTSDVSGDSNSMCKNIMHVLRVAGGK